MKDLGKILPVDAYKTYLRNSLPSDYMASLIHLYQPLLGLEATYLYQFLLAEASLYTGSTLQTHHTLMTYLNRPLDVVYQARLSLEAFGLLKTYRHTAEDKEVYTYILTAPFNPQEFLNDPMLSELLYREIGDKKFNSITQLYSRETPATIGKDITVSFNEVFQTVEPQTENIVPAGRPKEERGIRLEKMDFTYLQQVLLNKMIPAKKVLTETNRRIISQLREMYQLDQYEIEKALLWALTDENLLDVEQFKAACNDMFQGKYNQQDAKLRKKQPVKEAASPKLDASLSKTERLAKHLASISPKELLEDLSAGKNASAQDMKMISDISTRQNLSAPVMNVAIFYCMLQSNMKLSKNYLETIASHWSRLGFKTAEEAMTYAAKETQPKTNQRKRQYTPQKQVSQEVIPDWFENRKKKTATSNNTATKTEEMDEKERDEMLAILKRHSSKGQ